jgi:hypothetical protein
MFSPKLGELLLKHGAVIKVSFDGAEFSSEVLLPANADAVAPASITLAQFLRGCQDSVATKALNERKISVTHRIVSLGGDPPDLSSAVDDTTLDYWIATQPTATRAALLMGSDGFRAFMRAQNNQTANTPSQETTVHDRTIRGALSTPFVATGEPPAEGGPPGPA